MTPFSSSNIYQVLRNYFSNLLANPALFKYQVIVTDSSYFSAPSAEDIQTVIKSDPTLLPQKYRRDIFDCDDYATYLKTKMNLIAANTAGLTRPYAFGYIITEKHAFNLGIDSQKKVYIINTQSEDQEYIYPDSIPELREFLALEPQNQIKLIYL